ncbi:MAG: MBL fold metallo-hydrolase [Gemmatimonadota bacterium]
MRRSGGARILGMLVVTATLAACSGAEPADPAARVAELVESARTAAGQEHQFLFGQVCGGPIEAIGAEPVTGAVPGALPNTDPDRGDWYTAPVQVFDDLFYLGQTRYAVWGLRTSEGIILFDAIFDYSVEAEVIDGLQELGIDPAEIRFAVISHGHRDHVGGAGILQQYGARIVMGEADWDMYENSDAGYLKATRDIVATDGMEIELGDHVVRTYLTPGHTHGTISSIFTVHDHGEPHVVALWGGTLFNFRDSPEDPRRDRLVDYEQSARHFREVASEAGADIILSNHPPYDGSTVKIPMLAERATGDPHPYVLGADAVGRFLTVAEECAVATRIAENELPMAESGA